MLKHAYFLLITIVVACADKKTQSASEDYTEPHRPQIHFTPKAHWMNDPNGMVYLNNKYHLFYQYYPDSSVWGPMHWGHAISKDLIHWEHQPIALYPDSLGYIFSGSAVVDSNNTSGFGKDGKVPLIAIFTHHDTVGEKAKRNDYQAQSIAYSLDEGQTWTKYANNPVLKNPGIKDFRDPKVMWYEAGKKWVMTLATLDRVTFFSSKDLRNWTKESEFGKDLGAHGGVWECPDLFPLDYLGKQMWVLLVSINPGGPNGGSATQYFTGNFDGKTFTPSQTGTRWIDYGPDNYAGVTWSNTGNRKLFIGWMSNWQYANLVPTEVWRSAMTIPRELKLSAGDSGVVLTSEPAEELNTIQLNPVTLENTAVDKSFDLSAKIENFSLPARIDLAIENPADFSLILSNDDGEELVIGYIKNENKYFIDRAKSGKVAFEKGFAARHFAPRLSKSDTMSLTMILDVSSAELFGDGGVSVMTEIFFPTKPFNKVSLQSAGSLLIRKITYSGLNDIWKQ